MSNKLIQSLAEIKTLPVITLETITEHLKDQAHLVLCLIVILPFMQPIPIPGLSSILGVVALLQGVSLIFSRKPLLTKKMKKMVITSDKFDLIYKAAVNLGKISTKISIFKHPIVNSRTCHVLGGISIILSAAFLSLPLPIPFSNFVPAISIALICVGLLEEDLALVLCGHTIAIVILAMTVVSLHMIRENFPDWIFL